MIQFDHFRCLVKRNTVIRNIQRVFLLSVFIFLKKLQIPKHFFLFFAFVFIVTNVYSQEESYYSCSDYGKENTIVELSSNASEGFGWLDFQGTLFKTDFDVDGLERHWHWLKSSNGKQLSFVISAGGQARYYDFSFADDNGFAKPRDVFECSNVERNELYSYKGLRDQYKKLTPTEFAGLGTVDYARLEEMISYSLSLKQSKNEKIGAYVKFCLKLMQLYSSDLINQLTELELTSDISKVSDEELLRVLEMSNRLSELRENSLFADLSEFELPDWYGTDKVASEAYDHGNQLPSDVVRHIAAYGGKRYCALSVQVIMNN